MALAVQHHNAGRLPEAESIYRQILQDDPNQPDALHLLGVISHHFGKIDDAVTLIGKALSINPGFVAAHCNLGNALYDQGNLEDAAASYQKALTLNPEDLNATFNLGNILQQTGRLEEAVARYQKALSIKPDFFLAHNNLGNVFKDLERLDEAAQIYRMALTIKPDFAEIHNNLCTILENSNRIEELRQALSDFRLNCPGDPRIALREAQVLKFDGDYAAARDILERADAPTADPVLARLRLQLLGDLCDRLDDPEVAFSYFSQSNDLGKQAPEADNADAARYTAMIDYLKNHYTADWVNSWQPLENSEQRPDPVFIVGFPRSGTTLLDTIVRSHGAISVVEEKPAIVYVRNALALLPTGYPESLATLTPAKLVELRRIYFAELDSHLKPEDRSAIIIDKLPLNIVDAGLIYRIFPKARFVFVQRHPCDCVLSCFMQSFELSDAMASFQDLESAARLYDKVMVLWQQYQAVLPLQIHMVRYENLIEAFEETLTPLFDFLGLDWDDGVRDYAKTAYQRGRINTPSYNQVTQPLYTRARGRWQRYRAQMQPALPFLLPWAKRFGYED